ncbi:hypothetical protein VSDG_07023 [Cytospora chrysosperma]|uniref:Uncharacterized protein n=1 Tax=Cytospora chrysosperma TaxID=252740 RepID=A0A423VS72_CYTCH|nr:hypothetical protein VSDG_07023 [Valsa sordida]
MLAGVEAWLKGKSSGTPVSPQPMVFPRISYDWERLWPCGIVIAAKDVSVNGVDISLGGVHGIPGPYTSAATLGSTWDAGPLPTPMSANEDIDWLRFMDSSMLVVGVVQLVSSL